MRFFTYTASFLAPFGVYTDDLILSTARNFRAGLDEQANVFSRMEFRAESEEGTALLRCGGTSKAIFVEQEVGLYSLHGTMYVSMEAENPERAEETLTRAFERMTTEKGTTILEQSSRMDDTKE